MASSTDEGHPPLLYLASLCATLVEENHSLLDQKYGTSASTKWTPPIHIPEPIKSIGSSPFTKPSQLEGNEIKETTFLSPSVSKQSLFQRTLERVRQAGTPGLALSSSSVSKQSSSLSSGLFPLPWRPERPQVQRRRTTDHTSAGNRLQGHSGLPFACFCCDKAFATDAELVDHAKSHMSSGTAGITGIASNVTPKRSNQCPVCGKCFSKNAHLTSHLRIHTGEKPFQCNVCGKQFTQKSTLNRHSRVHTGEKPFQCKICMKRFAQQSTLTSHMRTHTGERPFQCDICHKRFNKSGHLYRHKRIVHARRPEETPAYGPARSHSSYTTCIPITFVSRSETGNGVVPPPEQPLEEANLPMVPPVKTEQHVTTEMEGMSLSGKSTPAIAIGFPSSVAHQPI